MPTYTCTITIDKDAGITLVVEDKETPHKQTVKMTGDSIICTVEGSKTSTITQTEDTITVDVENFKVNADTIAMVGKKTIALTTQSDNVSIESGADLSIKAAAKGTWDCATAEFTASTSCEVKSPTITLNADTKLDLKSGAQAGLQGAQVSIKGSASVAIESSAMAEIKGSAVQVSAPMIKLG